MNQEPFFANETLNLFDKELNSIDDRIMTLIDGFLRHSYRNEGSMEFAKHGFGRRLFTLKRCVQRVFELLPPELNDMPTDEAIDSASVNIQAFVFNAFGAIDNLAWIWVGETEVVQPNGKPVPASHIGLGPENATVRDSLPKNTKEFLVTMDSWFEHLHNFRHALAHRIPLYVFPYIVPPENDALYTDLDKRKWEARAPDEFERIRIEQRKLVKFRPIMKHTLYDEKPPIAFHVQLLGDLKTVEVIGAKMLEALRQ